MSFFYSGYSAEYSKAHGAQHKRLILKAVTIIKMLSKDQIWFSPGVVMNNTGLLHFKW